MKLIVWKTVRSREGRPDEFHYSFSKKPYVKEEPEEGEKPLFYLFSLSEEEAREAFGDEIDKIIGILVVHPIKLTLSIREIEDE